MKTSALTCYRPNFAHIYIEEAVVDAPEAQSLCAHFPAAQTIVIDDYKAIFNRPGQHFQTQKHSMKLILARKKQRFLYPVSGYVPDFGHPHAYYSSVMLNCVYNCDYCYLQGLYNSGNLVIFVNWHDFTTATDQQYQQHNQQLYLCVSYDTDLLAFEQVFPACRRWIDFTRQRPGMQIEIRTKSANFAAIADIPPTPQVILAWTLSPASIATNIEAKTPPLAARLDALRDAMTAGWPVRLCLDPILLVPDWQTIYQQFMTELSTAIPLDQLHDVSLGSFRMNADYLQRLQRQRPDAPIVHHPFHVTNRVASYTPTEHTELMGFMQTQLRQHLPNDKIIIYNN